MDRRWFIFGFSAIGLTGCSLLSNYKRIGPYHWIRRVDGSVMIVWGSEGDPICGINYYDATGRNIPQTEPEGYGVTEDWIIVKTNLGYHLVPQTDNGYSAGSAMSLPDLTRVLAQKGLTLPKMKPL